MGALPCVLLQVSTGSIIKHGLYPREDMAEILDLDPDYKWLVKVTPFPAPDYDPRYFVLNTVQAVTTEAHPEYSYLDVYKTTYTVTKRPVEEIEFHVRQAQKEADTALCNTEDQLSFTLKVQSALDRQQQGLTLTTEEQAILDKSRAIKVKLDKNQDNYNVLMTSINAGNEPDMDAGWESA